MTTLPYFLGCPVWACDQWRGALFREGAPRSAWLHEYSTVFNTVEGNSTFYGLPTDDVVQRWCDDTAPGFQFVPKFPRTVTHDIQLRGAHPDTRRFLQIMDTLNEAGRAGPAMIQLPPGFCPAELPVLKSFLERLPVDLSFAVEVRHPDFFSQRDEASRLDDLLEAFEAERVTFDSRALHSLPATDEVERVSQGRKPHLPVAFATRSQRPILRLIGRNQLEKVTPWIDEWAPVIAEWIADGRRPYVFTHTPDDQFAPAMATMFHQALQRHMDDAWRPLPIFPGARATQQKKLW